MTTAKATVTAAAAARIERRALVTGGSRGIGRAVALRLAAAGHAVAVGYRADEDAARAVAAEIEAGGGRALAIRADMGEPEQVRELFDRALASLGGLDVLVNNAGISLAGEFASLGERDFDRVFAVNVKGAFLAMQEAAIHLTDGGRVVNISTGYVQAAHPGVGVYTATKAAVDAMGASLAAELGARGITVNSVAPGLVDTDGLLPEVRANLAQYAAMTPLGRVGRPGDIADVVAFLVSDEARWITGQVLAAAGGLV
jgi:3-oxoacyl-[acyl-carrier protein] reductase